MKYLLRLFLFQIIGLWFTSQLIPTIVVLGNWQTLFLAGFTLGLLLLIVKPVLKILFLPINFITFGFLSWLINVIILYFLTLVIPQVQISAWTFPGFTFSGFVVPAFHLTYFLALIVSSLLITFISDVLEFVANE